MMGHTFLFRGEPKGRADSLDWWLSILSCDALFLSDLMGGSRAFAKLSESFETLAAERSRKGRARYREDVAALIERLLPLESVMMSETRGRTSVYPSLVHHVERKVRYALRLARCADAPRVCGASAMKEVSFALSLVCDVAHLCPQYLDPSEKAMMKKAQEMGEMLDDCFLRANIYGAAGSCGYEEFLRECDEAVVMYRQFLSALAVRSEEGRLHSVFPPSFLIWADGTCALVHRILKRLANGKSVTEAIDEEEETADGAMRTAPLTSMAILADQDTEGCAVCETVCEVREEMAEQAAEEPQEKEAVDAMAPPVLPEKIYAKASDYKNITLKAIKKSREHGARTPRPLGKGR